MLIAEVEIDDAVSRSKSNAIRERNLSSDPVDLGAENAVGTLCVVEHRVPSAEATVQREDDPSNGTLTKPRFCNHSPLRNHSATPRTEHNAQTPVKLQTDQSTRLSRPPRRDAGAAERA